MKLVLGLSKIQQSYCHSVNSLHFLSFHRGTRALCQTCQTGQTFGLYWVRCSSIKFLCVAGRLWQLGALYFGQKVSLSAQFMLFRLVCQSKECHSALGIASWLAATLWRKLWQYRDASLRLSWSLHRWYFHDLLASVGSGVLSNLQMKQSPSQYRYCLNLWKQNSALGLALLLQAIFGPVSCSNTSQWHSLAHTLQK